VIQGKQKVTVSWCDVDKVTIRRREYEWRDHRVQRYFRSYAISREPEMYIPLRGDERAQEGCSPDAEDAGHGRELAHFHPRVIREVYIDMPSEETGSGVVGEASPHAVRTSRVRRSVECVLQREDRNVGLHDRVG